MSSYYEFQPQSYVTAKPNTLTIANSSSEFIAKAKREEKIKLFKSFEFDETRNNILDKNEVENAKSKGYYNVFIGMTVADFVDGITRSFSINRAINEGKKLIQDYSSSEYIYDCRGKNIEMIKNDIKECEDRILDLYNQLKNNAVSDDFQNIRRNLSWEIQNLTQIKQAYKSELEFYEQFR